MKKKIMGGFAFAILLIVIALFGKLTETVEKSTYQVKQTAITGTMSAKMTPGLWLQLFGDIDTWPKAETFFFTIDGLETIRT